MMERSGQVKSVTFRDFQTTKLWSFQLEGSDRFFRTGKNKPMISEGVWIKFEERNGIVQMETIMTIDSKSVGAGRTSAVTAQTNPEQSLSATPTSSSTPDVGTRIRYQAARRDASNIIIAALHCDHLPHASNVAKGKRLDLLLQYIEEVTQTLLTKEDAS